MIHARTVLPAGTWDASSAADRVVLPHDGRHRRRIAMRGEGDVVFLLDLPEATRLKHGDGLSLDDGRVVAVVAAEEPVAEIVAKDPHHLARLAWHLGNRHVAAQLLSDRIRTARDGVLEEMARGLGASVEIVEASFEPEGGAYEAAEAHGHGHADHKHAHHDHGHHGHGHHHEHGEDCGCGHDHSHDHGHGHTHTHIGAAAEAAHSHEHKHEHEHHDHGHGSGASCGHDHSHDKHSHAHGHERDVLHVGAKAQDHDHHEHGADCGCGHDHHDHSHGHTHTHIKAGHDHG